MVTWFLDFHSSSWVQLITSLPPPQGAQGRRPPEATLPMQTTEPSGY